MSSSKLVWVRPLVWFAISVLPPLIFPWVISIVIELGILAVVIFLQPSEILDRPEAVRCVGLGSLVSGCLAWFLHSHSILAMYFTLLGCFHFSEYMIVATCNSDDLKIDSFMIDHSFAYHVANIAAVAEHLAWTYFGFAFKQLWALSLLGFVMCLAGNFVRKYAMFQASVAFTLLVQTNKRDDHHLVTTGLYSVWRHPGYVGYGIWAIGTQILLINPICLVGFIGAVWQFFNERIPFEEEHLVKFFGQRYRDYQRKVPAGIPFVPGFQE